MDFRKLFATIYNDLESYPTLERVAERLGISRRTVRRRANQYLEDGMDLVDRGNPRVVDEESVKENVRLAKNLQKERDKSRVERKSFREYARIENAIEELNNSLINILNNRRGMFGKEPARTVSIDVSNKVGVIQLSDLHFGELVSETLGNRFDMDVASMRLRKLANKCRVYFRGHNIKSVAVFFTGDCINSSRRVSEVTAYADARVKVVFNAYLILGAFLEDLYRDFNLTVASIVGNESRLAEYFDTTDYLVSDNFDYMLHQLLQHTHEKSGLTFLDIHGDPVEKVVGVNGVNFLLVHGNVHKGLAHTNKIETEVSKIKARYAGRGVRIDYVICGHVHSSYLSNNFSRSASLVGSNAFSERTLNFTSKAAQNAYIVSDDGDIDAVMLDLQGYEGVEPYPYDRENIRYFNEDKSGTMVIQSVLV